MERHARRMQRFQAAGLYLVTGEAHSNGRSTVQIVRQALEGGVRLIQLREKDKTSRELFELAGKVRQLCNECDALLIINDRVDLALATNADGVHLGNDDLPASVARRLFPDGIIGVSTHSEAEATGLETSGASYFNIGPVFPTKTKAWDDAFLSVDRIPSIAACCSLPFTVMGGINRGNLDRVVAKGARTVAVVSAITKADDPVSECRRMLAIIRGQPG